MFLVQCNILLHGLTFSIHLEASSVVKIKQYTNMHCHICHNRGHTDRGFVVVQIAMDLVTGESGSCSKTCLTSAGDAHEVLNIKVEDGTDIEEEEEIPMPVFCAVKVEQDEVSLCVFVYMIRHTWGVQIKTELFK